jgi:hypothetical protein
VPVHPRRVDGRFFPSCLLVKVKERGAVDTNLPVCSLNVMEVGYLWAMVGYL